MKRVGLLLLVFILLLTACTDSPKQQAQDFAKYLPAEIGDWERDDDETVRLLSSTVTSEGYISMMYEGPDDAIAYVVVEVFPGEDGAEVALDKRVRELLLMGVQLEADRKPKQVTAQVG